MGSVFVVLYQAVTSMTPGRVGLTFGLVVEDFQAMPFLEAGCVGREEAMAREYRRIQPKS